MYKDLRDFVESVEQLGALRRIDRADPQFNGFPRGFRILTNAMTSALRAALALGLDPSMRPLDALKARPDDGTQSRRRAPSPSQRSSHWW